MTKIVYHYKPGAMSNSFQLQLKCIFICLKDVFTVIYFLILRYGLFKKERKEKRTIAFTLECYRTDFSVVPYPAFCL